MKSSALQQELKSVSHILNTFYLPGEKVVIKEINTGFVNKTYLIKTLRIKYILRLSAPEKTLLHIKLEIELLNYLQHKKFPFTPKVLPNIYGKAITIYKGRIFTLQNFVAGKTVASWNNLDHYTLSRLKSHFMASAQFSSVVKNFPFTDKLPKTGLEFQLKHAVKNLNKLKHAVRKTPFGKILAKELPFLHELIKKTQNELRGLKYNQLPKQLVHFDLHPGNFHFSGNKVSGMFDFDWIRQDARIADLASTIGQSCYYLKGKKASQYNAKKIRAGLHAYYGHLENGKLVSKKEGRILPSVLKAYMIFQFLWTLEWYSKNYRHNKANEYISFFLQILITNYQLRSQLRT